MIGSPLPESGYDRYITDFFKGGVWPLMTRLAKKSFTTAIPNPSTRLFPLPTNLTEGENSTVAMSQNYHHSTYTNIPAPIPPTNPTPFVITIADEANVSKGKAVIAFDVDTENINPNKQFIRQINSESLRNVLKRCRSNAIHGDFNEVISTEDKIGGPRRIIAQIDAFCPVVDGCHLCQIPYEGERITWTNKSQGNDNVKERLDYGFVDVHWESTFHAPSLKHLDFDKADHRAIKATITALVDQIETPKWHHATFGKLKKEIKDSHEHVAALQNSPRTDPDHFAALQNFELILDELLGKEKDYWHQRFRITWMQSSDSNTQFFHQLANARSATNRIKKLKDSNDNTQTSTHGLVDIISSHFQTLFSSQGVDDQAVNTILATIPTTIDENSKHII
uniref:Endonuclease/exonuclease/phosphatase domain-containing protein n=1 Tax=Cannabis sativa TaxID=3483 RepID=A0A803NUD3_CANSA